LFFVFVYLKSKTTNVNKKIHVFELSISRKNRKTWCDGCTGAEIESLAKAEQKK